MLFSERIRTLRKEQGVLQRKLAQAIGVDVPMYSRYEHGERHPKRAQVVKLARLLNTDADELVAMWLAEEAINAIGHDKMSGRAADLLREQLGGGLPANPSEGEESSVADILTPSPSKSETEFEPEGDPTLIKAAELDASQRTLLSHLDNSPMPYYVNGDARQAMATIADESIDCIVTTPPYWNLKKYNTESISSKSIEDYVDELLRVMAEAWRVLKPQGSLWLNLADYYEGRALQGLPWRVALRMVELQRWTLRNDVVWNKPQGEYGSSLDHLRNVHEFMFHFVKNSDNFYFAEEELRRYAKQVGQKTNVMPGDVWSIEPEKSAIERYRICPESMCLLPIVASCPPGGIVLDPYCGTGTTCKVAYDLNRRSIGIDINDDRLARARTRIEPKSLSLF